VGEKRGSSFSLGYWPRQKETKRNISFPSFFFCCDQEIERIRELVVLFLENWCFVSFFFFFFCATAEREE